ncbi:aminoglycoside phosphotransferase family protein [Nonomuraea longicatena]|uniref:Aminoglycoside phosphotransferase domain-containing protein n=1 Tax=Nonomuraea longicatena TaxID=83682 RepID=A0ABN1R3Y8_9ACTN
MQDRPEDLTDRELAGVLREHWDITDGLRYAPVGFGDHHWTAGERWFVTVVRLAKDDPGAAFDRLCAAMDTAATLAAPFVVAPMPSRSGRSVVRLGDGFAVTVFPKVDGTSGEFGEDPGPEARVAMAELLAELHRADPAGAPPFDPVLGARGELEAALEELDRPWSGGPYSEPARAWLRGHGADAVREVLAAYDEWSARPAGPRVITHGEPHPGNVLRSAGRLLLVDWDTVAVAAPERDLWLALGDDRAAQDVYTRASGHEVSQERLALFRLRWDLDDLSIYVGEFRAPHGDTADLRTAWEGVRGSLARAVSILG